MSRQNHDDMTNKDLSPAGTPSPTPPTFHHTDGKTNQSRTPSSIPPWRLASPEAFFPLPPRETSFSPQPTGIQRSTSNGGFPIGKAMAHPPMAGPDVGATALPLGDRGVHSLNPTRLNGIDVTRSTNSSQSFFSDELSASVGQTTDSLRYARLSAADNGPLSPSPGNSTIPRGSKSYRQLLQERLQKYGWGAWFNCWERGPQHAREYTGAFTIGNYWISGPGNWHSSKDSAKEEAARLAFRPLSHQGVAECFQ